MQSLEARFPVSTIEGKGHAFACKKVFETYDYDLTATLNSGQAFRWFADAGFGWSSERMGFMPRL
jgi:hypothetical protein